MRHINLLCLYAAQSGFEIEGSRFELRELAETARHGLDAVYEFASAETSAAPFDEIVRELIVRRADAAVVISYKPGTLVLVGGVKQLSSLAAVIESASGGESGSHLHLEYYPGHPFLAESAEPLVISTK